MKTVFVLVDALKSLYLTEENMPFLYSLSRKGLYIKNVIPCAGFCERSEILSGLDGFDTGNFTAIGYLPEYSPYRDDEKVLRIASKMENGSRRLERKFFSYWRKKNKRRMNPYLIPFPSLRNFALTEDGDKQLIPHRTIFDILDEHGYTYTMEGFTSLSDLGKRTHKSLLDLLLCEIKKETYFIPLYIGITDTVGHLFGADLMKIKPYLRKVDSQLKELYQNSIKADYSFCVLGDHGMVPVTKKVDPMGIVKKTGCRLHEDYEVFYDSTMARYWFFNDYAYNNIRAELSDKLYDNGFFVDKSNYMNYRIPLDLLNNNGHSVYGDLIWCAKPGVLISPDYFHSESAKVNGMHGYVDIVKGHGTGLFVKVHSNINHEEFENTASSNICGELCKSLDIVSPNPIEWKRKL